MQEFEPDFDKLRADMALFIQQIRATAPLADPELQATLFAAANELESNTPVAIQEYVDLMAQIERDNAGTLAMLQKNAAVIEQIRADAALPKPEAPQEPIEEFTPTIWESARQRLLGRLSGTATNKVENRPDFLDWAYSVHSISMSTGPQSATPPPSSIVVAPNAAIDADANSNSESDWDSWLAVPRPAKPKAPGS